MMAGKSRTATFTLIAFVVVVIATSVVAQIVKRRIVAAHQRAIIRELDTWADEYSQITDRKSAVRSAGMINYISTYYVPADGYRSDEETENRLHKARQRTINKISTALSVYTGTSVSDPLDWPSGISDLTRQVQEGG